MYLQYINWNRDHSDNEWQNWNNRFQQFQIQLMKCPVRQWPWHILTSINTNYIGRSEIHPGTGRVSNFNNNQTDTTTWKIMFRLVIWPSMMLLGPTETELWTLRYGLKPIQTSLILMYKGNKLQGWYYVKNVSRNQHEEPIKEDRNSGQLFRPSWASSALCSEDM